MRLAIYKNEITDIKLQIFGQQELQERLRKGLKVYTHCISITNPECTSNDDVRCSTPEDIRNSFRRTLELEFWDENNENNLHAFSNKKLVSEYDIREVLKFIEATIHEADGYTLHCWRGISRSTSIALGILHYIYNDETIASERLIDIRRNAMPLKRAVEHFDKILKSNLADFKNTVYRARMNALRKEVGCNDN